MFSNHTHSAHSRPSFYVACITALILAILAAIVVAQDAPVTADSDKQGPQEDVQADRIPITSQISDSAIAQRITKIFSSIDQLDDVHVAVTEGVVTLSGEVKNVRDRHWTESIANRTEGVVAVINNLEEAAETEDDTAPTIAPVLEEGQELARKLSDALPTILLSLAVLIVAWLLARLISRWAFSILDRRINSLMLSRLVARLCALPVLLIGFYLILNITGLGNLASTVIGGTGLLGLVIGFAFRDIAENFLASILISLQRPFRLGDTIKILEYTGVVQAVTTRGTVLMTLEGNHVQIPNTIIYKEPITNYSANPHMRLDFVVGIGYDASIARAQEIALENLLKHPAVANHPEPMVLAEALSASTVNMRIYFWVDSNTHSILKVKSAVIRLVKHAFTQHGISMPDDAREVIFPQGIHITTEDKRNIDVSGPAPQSLSKPNEAEQHQTEAATCTPAEASLTTETTTINEQAERSTLGEGRTNLLK